MESLDCTIVKLADGTEEYWCCPTGAGIMEVAGVSFELGCIRVRKEDLGGI